MNEIQIFNHEEFGEIRTIEIEGQIYFVGVDVAKALGYKSYRNAVNKKVDEDDKLCVPILDTQTNQERLTTIINESGLYSLVLASKLPGAKKFKRWVTAEVLPTIRKTGSYNPNPPKIEDKTSVYIENLNINISTIEKNSKGNVDIKKGFTMDNSIKESLKPFLMEYVKEITPQSKTSPYQFVCPFCSSGLGTHQTGAFTVYPETNSYYCFACGASGDIFNLYGELNKISDFKTIIDELTNKYKIYVPTAYNSPKIKSSKDYTKFFNIAEQHLQETDYLIKRGISLDTQRKFHCGYVSSFMYKGNQTTPAIIIPTSDTSFMWRSTTDNIKQKRGTAHILNPIALTSPYCFVVEGEIDCMSIDECGFSCIGLGSVSNIKKIFSYDVSKTILIIAMDNDVAGKKATFQLENLCKENKTPYITAPQDVWGDFKDANELLIADRQTLVKQLNTLSERALNLDKDKWLSQLQIEDKSECNEKYARYQSNKTENKFTEEKESSFPDKKQMIDYEIFSEFLEKQGYSIRYNQITHNFEFFGFDKGESVEHLAENVPTILQDQLKKIYTRVSKQTVIDYITRYATRHKYNPVLNAIQSIKWDGKDRINQIYDIFKIPADTEEGKYSRVFILKWLKQCVCGLFNDIQNPFSLDIILIFQGKQGIGKTRFFEMLALSSKFFGEGICLDPRDKDSVIQATSKWISELGELGSTMKKDMDSVKAFLTKSTDEYRTPYGKASLHYPRMTSFVGTVNDEQFLIDQTGNRRFVTIPLPSDLVIDYSTQIKPFNALQLWSQVYETVKNEDKASCFRLSEDEKRYLEKRNAAFVKPMKGECEVLDILEEQQTQEQGYICTFKEMTVLQFIQLHNLKYDAGVVGRVLKKYGYEAVRKRINGEVTRVIGLPYKYRKFDL